MSDKLPIGDRLQYERRIDEWGEKGPAHNVSHEPFDLITKDDYEVGGDGGNIAINSTERQIQRTFSE